MCYKLTAGHLAKFYIWSLKMRVSMVYILLYFLVQMDNGQP